jgi:hypothetical protein
MALNFTFQTKTTSLTTSDNFDSTLSPEDNVYNLDVDGGSGSGDLNNPTGSGNDFEVIEYFESTTSDTDMRIYNYTGSPDIVIEAPSQSTDLIYYNLTIEHIYVESELIWPDDWIDQYLDPTKGAVGLQVNSTEMGYAYRFRVTSVYGAVFIDSISLGIYNPNQTHGTDFYLYILKMNETNGLPDVSSNSTYSGVQYFEKFTAPASFSFDEYSPDTKWVLENGFYYVGLTLADDPDPPLDSNDYLYWYASNDTFPNPPGPLGDNDGPTYVTSNHSKGGNTQWTELGVDCSFMYHRSGIGVTEDIDMQVFVNDEINGTRVLAGNATYYGAPDSLPPWQGIAVWSVNATNNPIAPTGDETFEFDIIYQELPDFIHTFIDYTLYCEFNRSDGTVYSTTSTYSVTSGNDVEWILEYDFDIPDDDFNGSFVIKDIPSDWTITSVKAPDNSEHMSNVTLDLNANGLYNLTIPYNISQSGTWEIDFTAPNYVDKVYSQEYSESGYFNQTTFYSSDEMRVKAYLENLTGPVGGGTATLTIVKPDWTGIAHTQSSGANSNGQITFADWEVPFNQATGNYHLQVLWINGTEVGFLDRTVKINSESQNGDKSSQSGDETKNYLTINADFDGIIERGHSLDVQLNVTRWGNVVEGLNITLKFLDETYVINVNNEVESSKFHVNQQGEINKYQEDSYFDITENDGIYDVKIETANLEAGIYNFEVYASKEGYEDTGSVFEFSVEKMSIPTFLAVYSPKVVAINPLPSLSVFIISIGIIWLVNSLLYSPIEADKFIDLYVYTNTGLGIDHVSFGSFETDEALMTGALAGISSLIAEATQTKTPPKVIEKEEFTIIIEYGEFIAASLFAKVKAKSFAHRKISHDLTKLVKDFESENKETLESWTGDLSKIEPLSKYIISEFRLKPSVYLADLKYEYGVLNYEKKNLFKAFLLIFEAFRTYLENKKIEKANQAYFLLEEILRKLVTYAPFTIIRSFANFMDTQVTNRSLKFALMRLVSKYVRLFRHS